MPAVPLVTGDLSRQHAEVSVNRCQWQCQLKFWDGNWAPSLERRTVSWRRGEGQIAALPRPHHVSDLVLLHDDVAPNRCHLLVFHELGDIIQIPVVGYDLNDNDRIGDEPDFRPAGEAWRHEHVWRS